MHILVTYNIQLYYQQILESNLIYLLPGMIILTSVGLWRADLKDNFSYTTFNLF